MGSYGSWWLGVLLCVFWLSHNSLKVNCGSSKAASSLMWAFGGKSGRSDGEMATEAEVKAAHEACKKALDAGMGTGATCEEFLPTVDGQLNLWEMPGLLVIMAKKSVKELMELKEMPMTKGLVQELTNHGERIGGMLCAVKKDLVCVDGKCKACGDLSDNVKSKKPTETTCAAADMWNSGGVEKGSSSLLIFGLTCVCVPILRSLFFL